MSYTKQTPTAPGNYYMKDENGEILVKVITKNGFLVIEDAAFIIPVDFFDDVEWKGPVGG